MAITLKKYSLSEIAGHTSKDDCWLIIHGKVYDVTTFLVDHPGGDDVLLQAAANGDATESFEDVGHSSTATSMMVSYLIGAIDGHEAPEEGKVLAGDSSVSDKAPQERKPAESSTSFTEILFPVLILALAFAAWYYLTYINVSA